jgi:uncharacterized protein (DUF2225 family)
VVKVEEITPFYQKKMNCTACKHSFMTTKIRSRFIKVLRYDSDFRPVYENNEMSPFSYTVSVCPHCGYSFSDEFAPYFAPDTLSLIQEKITNHWVSQNYGEQRSLQQAIRTFKLAIYCGTLKREKNVTLAGLFIRTAWLYRLSNNEEQEQRFMNFSANAYLESYSNDDFSSTQMSLHRILYMIAELKRRTYQYEDAAKFFSKVLENQKTATEPKVIEMARDQWHEMKEKYRELKKTHI